MSKINVGNPRLSSNSSVTGWADGNSLAKWSFGMSWIISFTLNLPQMWRSSIIPADFEGCLSRNGFILNDSLSSRSGRQHKHFLFPFHSWQCFKIVLSLWGNFWIRHCCCPFTTESYNCPIMEFFQLVRSEEWMSWPKSFTDLYGNWFAFLANWSLFIIKFTENDVIRPGEQLWQQMEDRVKRWYGMEDLWNKFSNTGKSSSNDNHYCW